MYLHKHILIIGLVAACKIVFAQQKIPAQVIVHLRNDASISELVNSLSSQPKKQLLSKSWNIWLLTFSDGEEEMMLGVIQKNPLVKLTQFNHSIGYRSFTPNDPQFGDQWNLENTGQFQGLPGADVKARPAWDLGKGGTTVLGDTIVIAVIDQGADLSHPDIKFWKNRNEIKNNGIDDDQNGYIDDYDGWNSGNHSGVIPSNHHGTMVSGIAAAIGNNGLGVCGVALSARVLPVALHDYGDEAQVVEAYSYIFDMRKLYNATSGAEGAFIVATNSSFGIDFGKPEDYPLWSAMYDSMGSVGILNAASTANLNLDVDTAGDIPSSCPSEHLIIVTNTTRYDRKSPTGGFGVNSVDIGAPGTAILSTGQFGIYTTSSGTSMSSPHIAGAVALMYSVACDGFMNAYKDNPQHGALIIKDYILQGADILQDLDGTTVSGGRLNLHSSMNMMYNDLCVGCFTVSAAVVPITCNGDGDGVIILFPLNGAPPYSYQWSNGSTNSYLNGLKRGKYWVKVTDDTGCSKFKYFEITSRNSLILSLAADSSTNGENGSVTAYVSGGAQPYIYQWDDPLMSSTKIVDHLSPGLYSVTVTDSNGCQISDSVVVGDRMVSAYDEVSFETTFIHPNPCLASVTVKTNLPEAIVHIIDLSGRILKSFKTVVNETVVDLSKYPSGMYLIKVTEADAVAVRKILRL